MYKLSLAIKSLTFRNLAIALLTTSLLSACGFQLSGDYLLDDELQTLYVSATDVHGELTRLVKLNLTRNQVKVLKHSKTDIPELRIISDKLDRRTLSLFANGQVAEYELIYSLEYRLVQHNKAPQSFNIKLRRDYLDDPQTAQAKSREMELMLKEMRQQAADQIVRQLSQLD